MLRRGCLIAHNSQFKEFYPRGGLYHKNIKKTPLNNLHSLQKTFMSHLIIMVTASLVVMKLFLSVAVKSCGLRYNITAIETEREAHHSCQNTIYQT